MRSVFCIAITVMFSLASPARGETPLAKAFADAWQRQPATAALAERQRAVAARLGAASALTAAAPSLELGVRSDQFNRNRGALESDLGLVLPLWLPGERSGARAAAEAEDVALAGRAESLRLQLAQLVRDAWWGWQAQQNEVALAADRLGAARRLRDDVARRFAAGDLSRADLNQADGVLSQVRAQQAETEAAEALARYRMESLTGAPAAAADGQSEALPAQVGEAHPLLREWQGRADLARRNAELARVQSRSNPELAVATRSDRAASGERADQTWALSLRIPFGDGPRHDARVATANAEAIEATVEFERLRERLGREAEASRRQVAAARQQLAATEERARLARENRGYYEKSFRLGETDLPARLRIEAEAFEAERALGRARIALGQGISQLRQSLGLLPE